MTRFTAVSLTLSSEREQGEGPGGARLVRSTMGEGLVLRQLAVGGGRRRERVTSHRCGEGRGYGCLPASQPLRARHPNQQARVGGSRPLRLAVSFHY